MHRRHRGLAGPVGAEEPEHLTAPDREVEPVQRPVLSVELDQTARRDGRTLIGHGYDLSPPDRVRDEGGRDRAGPTDSGRRSRAATGRGRPAGPAGAAGRAPTRRPPAPPPRRPMA